MQTIISLATNIYTYTILLGALSALYCAWSLARRQYLSVNKLFNLVTLSFFFGWLSAAVIQHFILHGFTLPAESAVLWAHPRPIVVATSYIAIAIITARYIRAIHYPYWRTIDMVASSLAVFVAWIVIGWVILNPTMVAAATGAVAILSAITVIVSCTRFKRSGLATGLHILAVFVVVGMSRFAIPSWQETTTIVEWTAVGIGGLAGLIIIGLRILSRSHQIILQEMPRGVSRSFYDTFNRAFRHKQLPKEG